MFLKNCFSQFVCVLVAVLIYSSQSSCGYRSAQGPNAYHLDSLEIMRLLKMGDSAYASKTSMRSFDNALKYFDSAIIIAKKTDSPYILARAYFMKANVYNAWNGEPGRTLDYYKKALSYVEDDPRYFKMKYYLKYQLAHNNDKEKGKDSAQCIYWLNDAFRELKLLPDSTVKKMDFVFDLAWVATNNGNYDFAKSIIKQFLGRVPLVNNPQTNNYKDHYMLSMARIEVLGEGKKQSKYLDSLAFVLGNNHNPVDSSYYMQNMAGLFAAAGRKTEADSFLRAVDRLNGVVFDNGAGEALQHRLLKGEIENAQQAQRILKVEANNRLLVIFLLLTVVCFLGFLFMIMQRHTKKVQMQSLSLKKANEELDDKVKEVQLLHKEMQHRIKNNLQGVYSLLRMQERKATDERTIENLRAARVRIEGIARLHDQLGSQSGIDAQGTVDVRSFIRDMLESVLDCFQNDNRVNVQFNAAEARLSEKLVLPLVFIINEWATNTLKHAVPPQGQPLSLHLSIDQNTQQVKVEFWDNGVRGAQSETTHGTGLGQEIIQLICARHNFELTEEPQKPFHFHLVIPTTNVR